jgi:CheY-like chemotaxis protein
MSMHLNMQMSQEKSEIIAASAPVANLGRGLVVSCNPVVQSVVSEALRLQAISCDYAVSAHECDKKISSQKFEVVFVDSELPEQGLLYMQRLRSSRSIGRTVLIAVTHTNAETAQAFSSGAQFCVQGEGSIQRIALDRVLRAAYGFILRERRRYFRCALNVSLLVQRDNEPACNGKLVNISEGGICFIALVQLTPGQSVTAQLQLPDTDVDIKAQCRIQWSNISGRAGAQFVSLDQKIEQELHHWLATRFELTLSSSYVPPSVSAGLPAVNRTEQV